MGIVALDNRLNFRNMDAVFSSITYRHLGRGFDHYFLGNIAAGFRISIGDPEIKIAMGIHRRGLDDDHINIEVFPVNLRPFTKIEGYIAH